MGAPSHRARCRAFKRETLMRLRSMPADEAVALLAVYCKIDPTYVPVKNSTSRRWNVRSTHGEFELLITGEKWYDTRARRGGGGAIDLAMHLESVSFVEAVKLLRRRLRTSG